MVKIREDISNEEDSLESMRLVDPNTLSIEKKTLELKNMQGILMPDLFKNEVRSMEIKAQSNPIDVRERPNLEDPFINQQGIEEE